MDIRETVLAETRLFWAAVPRLIGDGLAGKWVAFKDGEVKGTFDDEDSALSFALDKFGIMGGFVINQVAIEEAVPITAAAMFMM